MPRVTTHSGGNGSAPVDGYSLVPPLSARRRATNRAAAALAAAEVADVDAMPAPAPAPVAGKAVAVIRPTEAHGDKAESYEFGGPLGTAFVMIFSHIILYAMYYGVKFNRGDVVPPAWDWGNPWPALGAAADALVADCTPNAEAAALYFAFILFEVACAYVLPGLTMTGRPDETGARLVYHCNAYLSWWATLALLAYDTAFPLVGGVSYLARVYAHLGRMMTVSIIFGNVLSLAIYASAFLHRATHRMTGNHVYDFFMGAILHPRLGSLDIKMFAEIRISWFLLFILTAACAVATAAANGGTLHKSHQVLLLAHFLYANACAKGEHYVPPTWDIFYEKFGWMLCFWNFAGVPFLYSCQALFVATNTPLIHLSDATYVALTLALLGAYYIWDTSQSQKNHFRLECFGESIARWTLPRLPWQVIDHARHIVTARGTPLLTDGWYAYARKIHYSADIVMAFVWGATCGFGHPWPFFYVTFFTSMIIHRYFRDMDRCGKKYGKDWDRYLATVPHAFIPGVI